MQSCARLSMPATRFARTIAELSPIRNKFAVDSFDPPDGAYSTPYETATVRR